MQIQIPPMSFLSLLKWIDKGPLLDVIEDYREIITKGLFPFDADGRPTYNLVLVGRRKRIGKSADLVLVALYKLVAWKSAVENQCYVLAKDEDQAGDIVGS